MLNFIFVKLGSGKTTLIRDMIRSAKPPVVVIDVLGNFEPTMVENDESWVLASSTTEALSIFRTLVDSPDTSAEVLVVQDGNIARAVDFLSSALWHAHAEGTLVIDECDAVSLAEAPCFDDLIRYGRNRGVDILTGCRRPAEISKNITAGADLFYCFTTHEPRDLDYFGKILGDEYAEKLPRLEKYHGIYIDYVDEKTGVFSTNLKGKITRKTSESIL
jgi:hypothetical protein